MDPPQFFPPPEAGPGDAPLAYGGKLTPEWLLDAYQHGIFPWPVSERLLTWWSPNPRAIIELDGLYVSHRLARTCRSDKFQVTCNQAFADVMLGCATAPGRKGGVWITAGMRRAYQEMHRLGHAHSIEVWQHGELVGGLYGVAQGGAFFAESKFHRATDASKVALVYLVRHLQARGFQLLDIQQLTPHTESLGAVEIPRSVFLRRLEAALPLDIQFGSELAVQKGEIRYCGRKDFGDVGRELGAESE